MGRNFPTDSASKRGIYLLCVLYFYAEIFLSPFREYFILHLTSRCDKHIIATVAKILSLSSSSSGKCKPTSSEWFLRLRTNDALPILQRSIKSRDTWPVNDIVGSPVYICSECFFQFAQSPRRERMRKTISICEWILIAPFKRVNQSRGSYYYYNRANIVICTSTSNITNICTPIRYSGRASHTRSRLRRGHFCSARSRTLLKPNKPSRKDFCLCGNLKLGPARNSFSSPSRAAARTAAIHGGRIENLAARDRATAEGERERERGKDAIKRTTKRRAVFRRSFRGEMARGRNIACSVRAAHRKVLTKGGGGGMRRTSNGEIEWLWTVFLSLANPGGRETYFAGF